MTVHFDLGAGRDLRAQGPVVNPDVDHHAFTIGGEAPAGSQCIQNGLAGEFLRPCSGESPAQARNQRGARRCSSNIIAPMGQIKDQIMTALPLT